MNKEYLNQDTMEEIAAWKTVNVIDNAVCAIIIVSHLVQIREEVLLGPYSKSLLTAEQG